MQKIVILFFITIAMNTLQTQAEELEHFCQTTNHNHHVHLMCNGPDRLCWGTGIGNGGYDYANCDGSDNHQFHCCLYNHYAYWDLIDNNCKRIDTCNEYTALR